MNFDLSDEQQLLQDTVRQFVQNAGGMVPGVTNHGETIDGRQIQRLLSAPHEPDPVTPAQGAIETARDLRVGQTGRAAQRDSSQGQPLSMAR